MAELIMLRLEGILQSWGESAAFDNRTSSAYPTKSAIVGLLGCAMGLSRDSAELPELAAALTIGIRADRAGVLVSDFQTIQGMPYIINAEGKRRSGNTIVSPHWYLQDASFLVVIDTNAMWQERISTAMADPCWCIYLGRKNCIPARPVWDGIHRDYADISDALQRYPAARRSDGVMIIETEQPVPMGSMLSRPDVTRGYRMFSKRSVWRSSVRRADDVPD